MHRTSIFSIIFLISAAFTTAGCKKTSKEDKGPAAANKTPAAASMKTSGAASTGSSNKESTLLEKAMKSGKPVVVITTSLGAIEVQLEPAKAPITCRNFLSYVLRGHYAGTIFHRVMSNFMIQGGGFTTEKIKKSGLLPKIKNEADNGLSNVRGTIAMARTPDPHSAQAQFFINVKDNAPLDRANARDGWGYTVFGKVIAGMDVVDKIRYVKVSNQGGPFANLPDTMVVIRGMRLK